jgi:molybdopterin synthase catalytic subunit
MTQLRTIADELRGRGPSTGRVALVHRVGMLVPTDVTVASAVPTSSKAEAFKATRFWAKPPKTCAPIWLREVRSGGSGWGLYASPVEGPLDDAPGRGEHGKFREEAGMTRVGS